MPASRELPRRKEMRYALGGLKKQVEAFENHQLDRSPCMIPNIHIQPTDLDENSDARPAFFAPYPAHLLPDPDDEVIASKYYDFDSLLEEEKNPIDCAHATIIYFSSYISDYILKGHIRDENIPWDWMSTLEEVPFKGVYEFHYPQSGPTHAYQVRGGSSPHIKAIMYNDLNGTEHQILRGELLLALRLMFGQLRRSQFIQHKIAPILLFSFMGPQHARVIEVHFDGSSLVVRPTKLYDFRTKDEVALKKFAQWFFGKPTGSTEM